MGTLSLGQLIIILLLIVLIFGDFSKLSHSITSLLKKFNAKNIFKKRSKNRKKGN